MTSIIKRYRAITEENAKEMAPAPTGTRFTNEALDQLMLPMDADSK